MEKIWQGIRVIDRTSEVGIVRKTPASPLLWMASELQPDDWTIELSSAAIKEITQVARKIEETSADVKVNNLIDNNSITANWPQVRTATAEVKHRLDTRPGFAVLQGLPINDLSEDTAVKIYWLLGQEISSPVAQKWNGEMIYSVRDTGENYGYGVRGSRTSVELVFHVDNAFGLAVPDYVGLLCKQPARRGGISRFCSLYSVHSMLQKSYPEALQRLYQPMLFDRQKEHATDAAPVLLAPFFSWRNDRLFARANTSLVRKGYEVAQIKMDTELQSALDAVTEVCEDQNLWYEASLQRGHIQYLNNHEVAHYRSEFEDFKEVHKKRHLYRLWHRETGTHHYDGGDYSNTAVQ